MDVQLQQKLALGAGMALIGFLVGTFLLTIPTPIIREVQHNDFGVTVTGQTRPDLAVLAFDATNEYITTVFSDEKGVFVFEGLAVTTGTREMVIRVVDGGWRSSPPKRFSLTIPIGESEETVATSTGVSDELPPPGIPPASTGTPRTKPTTTATTTPPVVSAPQSITLKASVTRLYPTKKTGETLKATVEDHAGRPITGAVVKAVAHYSTGDVAYTLRGAKGGYNVSFHLPADVQIDTLVVVDVSAEFQGLTSTARVVFTPR